MGPHCTSAGSSACLLTHRGGPEEDGKLPIEFAFSQAMQNRPRGIGSISSAIRTADSPSARTLTMMIRYVQCDLSSRSRAFQQSEL